MEDSANGFAKVTFLRSILYDNSCKTIMNFHVAIKIYD